MKTILLFMALLAGLSLPAQSESGQLLEARKMVEQGNYEGALRKLINASLYNSESKAVPEAIDAVFREIERQQTEELKNLQRAERLLITAREEKGRADSLNAMAMLLYQIQDSVNRKARAERDAVVAQRSRADSLARRGATLLSALTKDVDASAFNRLFAWGLERFAFDSLRQKRDYEQASVYFSLSQFVRPNDTAAAWVAAANAGVLAEQFFRQGQIDSALTRYREVKTQLAVCAALADIGYENRQIARITEIKSMLNRVNIAEDDRLVLDGNWWVLPPELLQRDGYAELIIRNNAALTDGLPVQLLRIPGIRSLTVSNCPNLSELTDWGDWTGLKHIRITGNPVLRHVILPSLIAALESLHIEGNSQLLDLRLPAGTTGAPELIEVAVVSNPRLEVFDLRPGDLSRIKTLKIVNNPVLSPAFLPALDNLKDLEVLTLQGWSDLPELEGASFYPALRYLDFSGNESLRRISGFGQLPQLTALFIKDNDRLRRLTAFRSMPALDRVSVSDNRRLRRLSAWTRATQPETVWVENNARVIRLRNWRNIKDAGMLRVSGDDIVKSYITLRATGLFSTSDMPGFYLGCGIGYHRENISRWWSLMPSINFFRYKIKDNLGYTAQKRTTEPVTGNPTILGIAVDGNKNSDIPYLSVDLIGKFSIPALHVFYLLVGPSLVCRFPGRIYADLEGTGVIVDEQVPAGARLYGYLGAGAGWTWRRYKLFFEMGYHGTFQSRENRPAINRTFYSLGSTGFSATPLDNAYQIGYYQPTFDSFGRITIGVSYMIEDLSYQNISKNAPGWN